MTRDELIAFQVAHHDWTGARLIGDGDLGPKTRWALAIAAQDPRRQAIVARASACVGIVEVGVNRGREPDEWNERAGAELGSPYCASFASWCISVAGLREVKEAGAVALGRMFPPTDAPRPGDLGWFRTGPWQGHIGPYIGGNAKFAALIEGNHRNGVRVVRRRRDQLSFARTVNDFAAGARDAPLPPDLPLVLVTMEGTR